MICGKVTSITGKLARPDCLVHWLELMHRGRVSPWITLVSKWFASEVQELREPFAGDWIGRGGLSYRCCCCHSLSVLRCDRDDVDADHSSHDAHCASDHWSRRCSWRGFCLWFLTIGDLERDSCLRMAERTDMASLWWNASALLANVGIATILSMLENHAETNDVLLDGRRVCSTQNWNIEEVKESSVPLKDVGVIDDWCLSS